MHQKTHGSQVAHIGDLVQAFRISIANALEIPQSFLN